MRVLHGTGKPRLKFMNPSTNALIGRVDSYGDGFIRLFDTTSSFGSSILNMGAYTVNNDDKETWGKISRVDEDNDRIYVEWSNIFPKYGSLVYVKHTIIDLPYCQNNLIETFTPDFIVHQLYNGTRNTDIRGWWYSVILDYSRRMTASQLSLLDDLFDKDREYEVYFYPRLDNSSVYYSVDLDPETGISLAQRPFHTANKLFKIKLNGKTRLDKLPLTIDYGREVTEDGDYIVTEDEDYIGVSE